MFLHLTSKLSGALLAALALAGCAAENSNLDCFEVVANPSDYPNSGQCIASGNLQKDGADYIVKASANEDWFFLGDTNVLWADQIDALVDNRVNVGGEYRLLEGEYLTLKKINFLDARNPSEP